MRPHTLLLLLSAGATLLGTRLYVDHALARQPKPNTATTDHSLVSELESKIEQLRRDNASLRALITADAPITLDPALLEFVEKDLELKFRTPPIALQRSDDHLREAAGQLWLGAFGEIGLEIRSYAYDVLGILPPNQNFIGQLIAAETTGAVGIFDPGSGEILLAPDFDAENLHHQAGLVRLLAIALIEQHFPLGNDFTDDQFYSHLALQRGRASILQDRFYSIQARHNGFVDSTPNEEAIALFSALPSYIRRITTFPNTFGKDFIATLPDKSDFYKNIKSNKLSTQNLLLGTTHPAPAFTADDGEGIQLSTQLGALTVFGFIDQLDIEQNTLTSLLKKYKTDKLTISTASDKSATTQWQIDWSTPEAAQRFHTHAKQITSALESPPLLKLEGSRVSLSVTEALAQPDE